MAVWSEISLVELEGAGRIDAEYYQPVFIKERAALRALPHVRLGDVAYVTDGQHGYHLVDPESDIKHITAKCVVDNVVVADSADRLAAETHLKNMRSSLEVGDVLLQTAGTIGSAGVVTEDILPANIDQDVARICIHDKTGLSPWYVSVFINSELGRMQTAFEATGQVQKHLSLGAVRKLIIPMLPQRDVVEIAIQAYERRLQSHQLYAEAENLLLHELGLDTLDLSHELTYERNFREVAAAGRYDAKYFAPRYQRAMRTMARSGQTLGSVAPLAKRFFRPVADEPFNYIEIGNLGGGGHAESEAVMGIDAPSRAQWVVEAGDVITSTVRPIRRLTALIEPDQHGFVCSSGFAVLKPRDIAPELLTVYLRLPIVSEILDLHTTATMYPAIATDVLLNIPISQPSESATTEIVTKVQQSRQAREQAKQLLEDAKRSVEQMILGEEVLHVA